MASTPSDLDTIKRSTSTKKPRVKRRLEFSASDYKSKKKIRLKSDVIISIRPVEVKKHKIMAPRDQQIPAEESEAAEFVYGQLIWGRLKGYDWWPGRVVSYNEAQKAPPSPSTHWVKWFGDNKLSMLSVECLRPLSQFSESFNPPKMRGLYKKAIITSLEHVVRRGDLWKPPVLQERPPQHPNIKRDKGWEGVWQKLTRKLF